MHPLPLLKRNREPALNDFPMHIVVTAERYHMSVRSCIMDAAALHPLKIDVIQILKVHHSQKQGFQTGFSGGTAL